MIPDVLCLWDFGRVGLSGARGEGWTIRAVTPGGVLRGFGVYSGPEPSYDRIQQSPPRAACRLTSSLFGLCQVYEERTGSSDTLRADSGLRQAGAVLKLRVRWMSGRRAFRAAFWY